MHPNVRTFSTHTGYCHVLPDRLVLSKEPVYGESIAQLVPWEGRPLFFPAAALGLLLLVFSWLSFREGKTVIAALAVIFGFLLFRYVMRLTMKQREVVIPRDAIISLTFKNGQPPLTKAFFILRYSNGRGGHRNKVIPLPAFSSRWQDVRDQALEILEEEGLLDNS